MSPYAIPVFHSVSREGDDRRAARMYEDADDVYRFFEANPLKLADYVEKALRAGFAVLSTHMVQLAEKAAAPLISDGIVYTDLPLTFISPGRFRNVRSMVAAVRTVFRQ